MEHTLNVVHRGAVVEVHGERTNHTDKLNPIKLNAFTEVAECGCVMRVGLKFLVCLVCVCGVFMRALQSLCLVTVNIGYR